MAAMERWLSVAAACSEETDLGVLAMASACSIHEHYTKKELTNISHPSLEMTWVRVNLQKGGVLV